MTTRVHPDLRLAVIVVAAMLFGSGGASAVAQQLSTSPVPDGASVTTLWADPPQGISFDVLGDGIVQDAPHTPTKLRLSRLTIGAQSTESLEAKVGSELLWIESGRVLIGDEQGASLDYESGMGLFLADPSSLGLWSDDGATVLMLEVAALEDLPPRPPFAQVLLESVLTALPEPPFRLFLARLEVAPGAELGQRSFAGPVGVYVADGTLTFSGLPGVEGLGGIEGLYPQGNGFVIPLGAGNRQSNGDSTALSLLYAGVLPAGEVLVEGAIPPSPQPAVAPSAAPSLAPGPSSEPSDAPTQGPSAPPSASPVAVPDVGTVAWAKIGSILGRAHLRAGKQIREPSSSVRAGFVIRTVPPKGTLVAPDTRIDYVVSSGPKSTPTPRPTPTPPVTPRPTPRPTAKPTPRPTATPVPPPSVPGNLRAVADGQSRINVSWGSSKRATRYQLRYGSSVLALRSTSHTIQGLKAGTRYCFRVRAIGAERSSDWSGSACAKTDAAPTTKLATPSLFSATAASSTTAHISWFDTLSEDGYHIESDRGWSKNVPADTDEYTASVPSGARTCFRMYAYSSDGARSGWTRLDCVTTPG